MPRTRAVCAETRRCLRVFPRSFVGRLLLNYVLSNPYVDVVLVGMRDPRLVEINNAISDDVASRIDLVELHERYVR